MMKKNGFTLAEVLITLAIIGVIATMTLPALMTNIAEQQARTGLKKGINTLTEAAQMHEAIEGINYSGFETDLTNFENKDNAKSLYGLLAQRTSMDFAKSGEGKHSINGVTSDNYAVFFRDGSILLFNPADSVPGAAVGAHGNTNNQSEPDGLPYGIPVIYDTNGAKGPNQVSNCNGETSGAVADVLQGDNEDLYTVTCGTDKRVIKDQFGVRLRGAYAVPNGPAARWTFEK